MAGIYEAIQNLWSVGGLDIILPFLLFFTILFAVLQKTKLLGEKAKKFNIIIALVIALLIVIPHVVYDDRDVTNGKLGGQLRGMPDVVEIVNNSLPSIAVWVVAILMLLLFIGVGWKEEAKLSTQDILNLNYEEDWLKWTFFGVGIIVVGYIFGSSAGLFQSLPAPLRFLNDPVNQATLLIIIVFGLIIAFIVGGDSEGEWTESKREMTKK